MNKLHHIFRFRQEAAVNLKPLPSVQLLVLFARLLCDRNPLHKTGTLLRNRHMAGISVPARLTLIALAYAGSSPDILHGCDHSNDALPRAAFQGLAPSLLSRVTRDAISQPSKEVMNLRAETALVNRSALDLKAESFCIFAAEFSLPIVWSGAQNGCACSRVQPFRPAERGPGQINQHAFMRGFLIR